MVTPGNDAHRVAVRNLSYVETDGLSGNGFHTLSRFGARRATTGTLQETPAACIRLQPHSTRTGGQDCFSTNFI
jgi:hypothetical protein